MTLKPYLTAAAFGVALLFGAIQAFAHGQSGSQDGNYWNYWQCPGCGMGPGMMGQGMGPGMMGSCMGHGMMDPNMMGPNMMGQGMGRGMMQALPQDLSVESVRHMLEHQLSWQGNPNLKLGTVVEKDADIIVAEVVTKDGSVVQRFEVDRHTGGMRSVQ